MIASCFTPTDPVSSNISLPFSVIAAILIDIFSAYRFLLIPLFTENLPKNGCHGTFVI